MEERSGGSRVADQATAFVVVMGTDGDACVGPARVPSRPWFQSETVAFVPRPPATCSRTERNITLQSGKGFAQSRGRADKHGKGTGRPGTAGFPSTARQPLLRLGLSSPTAEPGGHHAGNFNQCVFRPESEGRRICEVVGRSEGRYHQVTGVHQRQVPREPQAGQQV
jgi:hypothetical protein